MQATSNSSPNSAQKLAWLLLHLLAQSSSGLGLAKPILSAQESMQKVGSTRLCNLRGKSDQSQTDHG